MATIGLIGAGKIGAALAQYQGFRQRGFRVAAVFDSDPAKIGKTIDGFVIRSVTELKRAATHEHADIAVITVPAAGAQQVADQVIDAGIRAIMNFAPLKLHVPDTVVLKTVNMALELEGLSFALSNGWE